MLKRIRKGLAKFFQGLSLAAALGASIIGGVPKDVPPPQRSAVIQVVPEYDPDLGQQKLSDAELAATMWASMKDKTVEQLIDLASNFIDGMDQLKELDRQKLEEEIFRMMIEKSRRDPADFSRIPRRKRSQENEDPEETA